MAPRLLVMKADDSNALYVRMSRPHIALSFTRRTRFVHWFAQDSFTLYLAE
jgi:hypothetical protein